MNDLELATVPRAILFEQRQQRRIRFHDNVILSLLQTTIRETGNNSDTGTQLNHRQRGIQEPAQRLSFRFLIQIGQQQIDDVRRNAIGGNRELAAIETHDVSRHAGKSSDLPNLTAPPRRFQLLRQHSEHTESAMLLICAAQYASFLRRH
jgi:hypothetical protein